MRRTLFVALLGLSLIVLSGCCMTVRVCCKTRCCPRAAPEAAPAPVETPDSAPPPTVEARSEALYDGNTGKPESLMVAADGWADVDFVAFGELHGNLVGARHQLALLKALAEQERPVALAMEFFERDMQADLDAYLKGEIDTATFKKKTRRNAAYDRTHGPLIEFCKENEIPVIAANAPRRLVTAYRKQDEDYDTWRASLSEQEQGWLPEETSILDDEYQAKFLKLMGPKRGPSFFRSQSLWDDAMAEAVFDFRSENPAHRVILMVGGFHVAKGLGTVTKYRLRRGKDEVRVISMSMSKDPALAFEDADLGAGDLVLKVPYPKRKARKHPAPAKATKAPSP